MQWLSIIDLMYQWQTCFELLLAILIVLSTLVAKDTFSKFKVNLSTSRSLWERALFLGGWKRVSRMLGKASGGRCSRVRVRRVVVPKNIQPARTKCLWTTTLTGKLSSFGFNPRKSSNFSFCFSTVGLSLTARAEAMARHASNAESC